MILVLHFYKALAATHQVEVLRKVKHCCGGWPRWDNLHDDLWVSRARLVKDMGNTSGKVKSALLFHWFWVPVALLFLVPPSNLNWFFSTLHLVDRHISSWDLSDPGYEFIIFFTFLGVRHCKLGIPFGWFFVILLVLKQQHKGLYLGCWVILLRYKMNIWITFSWCVVVVIRPTSMTCTLTGLVDFPKITSFASAQDLWFISAVWISKQLIDGFCMI